MARQKLRFDDFAKLLKPMEKRTSVGCDHEILLLLLFQILLLRFQILGLFGLLLLQMLDLRALRFHLRPERLYHTIGENVHGCFGGFGGQLVRFRLLVLVLRFRPRLLHAVMIAPTMPPPPIRLMMTADQNSCELNKS